jgi:hypothetical protein
MKHVEFYGDEEQLVFVLTSQHDSLEHGEVRKRIEVGQMVVSS